MQKCRYHAWPSEAWRTIGTASANLMMSRVLVYKTTHPQDEYTAATASLLILAIDAKLYGDLLWHLRQESIHGVVR